MNKRRKRKKKKRKRRVNPNSVSAGLAQGYEKKWRKDSRLKLG
jgi:hypothetical protein